MSIDLKRREAAMGRILRASRRVPEQRLGQFLFNAVAIEIPHTNGDPFYLTDEELAEACEAYAARTESEA